ncbi:MAG: hypothetical protein M2R45_04829 [Verrucomicrobia subdivision 3 bacterium]|nr:hypothetical protein [Limisphaerales bacterium]MCS1416656.1 hypothetical protein [Limisphaerales bacterium]
MSEPQEQPKLDLDLGSAFLPSWAQKSAKDNPYTKYEGREDTRSHKKDFRRSDRQRTRRSKTGNRRSNHSQRNDQSKHTKGQPRGSRSQDRDGQQHRPHRPTAQDRNRPGPKHRPRQEIIASLPNLKVSILPDQKGVESLAKQIRMQGRAYPLFDIASIVLKRPDRFRISTSILPDGKGQPVSEQWRCRLDDSLWLSQSEAIDHVLKQHFDKFYERLKTETAPPKGNFSFVAQCGISGKILGPPNYHGYQEALRSLHAERFSRMNFNVYKKRVKIVRDEETVKKWLDEQSWKTEYKSKAGSESAVLGSWDELIAHFKTNHLKEALETGRTLKLSAADGLRSPSKPIQELIRFHVEEQRRFPLQVATALSQMFAQQGLQFFKLNRTIIHVSVARPKYLNMNETPVSEGVKRIVDFVEATPNCTRKKLLDALRPQTNTTEAAADNASSPPLPPETAEATSTSSDEVTTGTNQASLEERWIITDLQWLIHQGHVIEFSNGKIETAKKLDTRPKKVTNKPKKETKAEPSADQGPVAQSNAPQPALKEPDKPPPLPFAEKKEASKSEPMPSVITETVSTPAKPTQNLNSSKGIAKATQDADLPPAESE